MHLDFSTSPTETTSSTVSDTSFISCSAYYGGGVAFSNADYTTVSGTSFTSCSAAEDGSAMQISQSQGVTLIDLALQDNIDGNAFLNNGEGPDIHSEASSFSCSTSCSVGQYGNCSELAKTSDANYDCYVNCGSCLSCPAGTSNDMPGSTSSSSCQVCNNGYVSTTAGAASCTSCKGGYYATDDSMGYGVITHATKCSAVS